MLDKYSLDWDFDTGVEVTKKNDGYVDSKAEDLTYSKMAKGLATSIKDIAKSKTKFCSSEEHDERYFICTNCEFLKNGRCTRCGCFMKIKTKFAAMKCPIGKWSRAD